MQDNPSPKVWQRIGSQLTVHSGNSAYSNPWRYLECAASVALTY
jgi:hypothetical protein